MFEFDDDFIEQIIKGVFDGSISKYELPEELYLKIADILKEGVYEGFGTDLKTLSLQLKQGISSVFDQKDLDLLTELRENIYVFSAAKTFQTVSEMSEALVDENGNIRTFKEFSEEADGIFEKYNENYLRTEYDTAIAEAQNAVRWNNIEKNKEVLPLLKYSSVLDDHTTQECEDFDGIVLPVDDEFWDEYMPPNHWNCRATVEQLEENEEKTTADSDVEQAVKDADVPNEFRFNAGKEKVVFSDEHPYYDVAAKDKEFAQNNFDLKIPDTDEDQ